MRTTTVKPEQPSWYLVDASGRTLGRLAARIAHMLRGKHKVTWSPHEVQSDHIVVINAEKAVLQGKKPEQKEYIRHSGTYGHLKRIPFARFFAKDPAGVLERAVRGMLPRNKLRRHMLRHLHISAGPDHPHEAQQPKPLAPAP